MATLVTDVALWAVVVLCTSLLAGLPVGFIAKSRGWSTGYSRAWTVLALIFAGATWWSITVWLLEWKTPFEWLGSAAKPVAFLMWPVASRALALRIVSMLASRSQSPRQSFESN